MDFSDIQGVCWKTRHMEAGKKSFAKVNLKEASVQQRPRLLRWGSLQTIFDFCENHFLFKINSRLPPSGCSHYSGDKLRRRSDCFVCDFYLIFFPFQDAIISFWAHTAHILSCWMCCTEEQGVMGPDWQSIMWNLSNAVKGRSEWAMKPLALNMWRVGP